MLSQKEWVGGDFRGGGVEPLKKLCNIPAFFLPSAAFSLLFFVFGSLYHKKIVHIQWSSGYLFIASSCLRQGKQQVFDRMAAPLNRNLLRKGHWDPHRALRRFSKSNLSILIATSTPTISIITSTWCTAALKKN